MLLRLLKNDDRFDIDVVLLHDVFVSQLLFNLVEALHIGVHDLSVLLAVE